MGRPPVRTIDDVIENARFFFGISEGEPFALSKVSTEAKALLARGRNFVPLRYSRRLLFLPSRFAGYLHNDFERHTHDAQKNGGVTDPTLSRILGVQPSSSAAFEASYSNLCSDLQVTPSRQRRDYWPEIPMEPSASEDWTPHEVAATLDAYLQMLRYEIVHTTYQKASIRSALLPSLRNRSKKSVEFKFCNISAVLDELGLFYVPGYKPLANYQALVRDIVERRLRDDPTLHKDLEGAVEEPPLALSEQAPPTFSELLVEPPTPRPTQGSPRGRRPSSGSKGDIAVRDARNRILGKAGEDFIVSVERNELLRIGRAELAKKVTSVADENRGYDVLSYSSDGNEKWIEVKTTNCSIDTAFYLTSNELETSTLNPEQYYLYRIFEFRGNRRMFIMQGDLNKKLRLEPVQYRARIAGGPPTSPSEGQIIGESKG